MTFDAWCMLYTTPANQRKGQAWMNHLYTAKPKLYQWVTVKTDNLDPFYHDNRISEFLAFVEREWNNF